MKNTKAKRKLKDQKAITLIALVITIIVLLILAAVTMITLTGENGILNRAKESAEQTEMKDIEERANLVKTDLLMDGILKEEKLSRHTLLMGISKEFKDGLISANKVIVENKKYDIKVDANLNITVQKHQSAINATELNVDYEVLPIDNDNADIYLYLDNEIITIRKSGDSHQIIDSQPNYFGGIPMIEFIENNSRKGCFEDAISIVDAIESVLSGTVNELEYFDNAYLHLKNLSATTNEDIQEMKNNRVLLTEDEGQAEFLTKTVNDAYIQNTLDRLTNDFHKLTKTPNISDESFGNNTSGVSLKFKLFPLEKSMALKEQKWRRSLNMMLKLIINRLNMLGGNFNSKEVKLTFTRALPTNQLEQSQMVAQLAGLVSNETLISQLDFIEKPKDELEKLKNEKSASLDTYNFEEVV